MEPDFPIDICICTFRRPHIAMTLRSLSRQILKPGRAVRVIVADNDETPGARELAERTARECALTLTYLHAPARNISIARNACLDAMTAPLYAFIDDDELATPQWLEALIAALENSNADVVLGPVQALYGPGCPDWIRKGDFHSTKPVWVNGGIRTGYSGNVLMRRKAPSLQGLRFRAEFGRSGGEDTVFFAAAYRAGGRFAYAPEAIVTETVPPERAQLSWLIKRYFRSGRTHGVLVLEDSGVKLLTRARNAAIAGAKALFCFAAAFFNTVRTDRMKYWLLRGAMHGGVFSRLLNG
jgi:succinoglycan biosynthesis protein ExoM